MKKIIAIAILVFASITIFAQTVPVTLMNQTLEIKQETYYIRAYKGDVLKINIQTELKNEKKGTYYELNNVTIYRENASDNFQHIINKDNVSKIDANIIIPSDGIYTVVIDRGGMKNFTTNLFFQRIAKDATSAKLNRKAIMVTIPDTTNIYTEGTEVYDYIRTSTPNTKTQHTPQYKEDQIFIDVSYALRINNKYVIPIRMPIEIMTNYKIAKTIKWGFMLTVSDEVYKALQKKVGQVATAAFDAGIGKAMSGKIDPNTGDVIGTTVTKGYTIFDNASTVNAIAGITGDVASQTGTEPVTQGSDAVQTITGFTGLTEVAGSAIGNMMPRIEDEVKYQVLTAQEYKKMLAGQPYTALKKGHGCYAQGEFDVRNPDDVYYLIIENERSTGGDFWDVAQAVGKTVLSQYVYTNVKVFVQRKVEVTYDKGYYDNTFVEVTNPTWTHTQDVTTKKQVIFEDQIKPYYQKISSPNIY